MLEGKISKHARKTWFISILNTLIYPNKLVFEDTHDLSIQLFISNFMAMTNNVNFVNKRKLIEKYFKRRE